MVPSFNMLIQLIKYIKNDKTYLERDPFEKLTKNKKKSYVTALESINLKVYKGEKIGLIGHNGSGKTSTIGKLASQFKMAGKSVMIGAGDTFRAAAIACAFSPPSLLSLPCPLSFSVPQRSPFLLL